MIKMEVPMARGINPVQSFGQLDGAAPVIFLFMDAFGQRPSFARIATWLTEQGYRVLVPDLFYAHRPYEPLSAASIFAGGNDRQRLGEMLNSLDQGTVDADVSALPTFCADSVGADTEIDAVGYCMGRRSALTAAAMSKQVVMGACFHSSNLAPEQGESAYRRMAGVQAYIYIGVAGIDPSFLGTEQDRLAQALRDAQVPHCIETNTGAAHGFVMDDLPVFYAAASERHRGGWQCWGASPSTGIQLAVCLWIFRCS